MVQVFRRKSHDFGLILVEPIFSDLILIFRDKLAFLMNHKL